MLNRLVDAGIEYVFVSNSDNLGATLDIDLLAYFAETGKSFIMEVRVSKSVGVVADGPVHMNACHAADPARIINSNNSSSVL